MKKLINYDDLPSNYIIEYSIYDSLTENNKKKIIVKSTKNVKKKKKSKKRSRKRKAKKKKSPVNKIFCCKKTPRKFTF
jgi:hypothetical protein